MNKVLALLMVAVLLLAILSGCAAKAPMTEVPNLNGGSDHYAPEDSLSGSTGSANGTADVLQDRKLIRKITIEAETEDMDALLADVMNRVSALGGYIESRNIQNGSKYSYYYQRTAGLVIRIPAESVDSFLTQVETVSNVVSTVENSDDVTLQYAATESRLKVLQTEESRLLEFLNDAKSVSEMLEIEKRLTQVQSEIESITTQLNTMDNLVDYATVTLNVSEVEVYTEVEEEEPTLWQRIGKQFKANLKGLLEFGEALLVFFIGNSPILLLIAGGVTVIVVLLVKKRRN